MVKALGVSSVTAQVKNNSNSIWYNCRKICSWLRNLKTLLEIRSKPTFLLVINKLILYKLFKDFTNHRKKTNSEAVFRCQPFPQILKYRDHRCYLLTFRNKRLLQTHIEEFSLFVWKFRLTAEPPLEYNQNQMPSLWPFYSSCKLQKNYTVSD